MNKILCLIFAGFFGVLPYYGMISSHVAIVCSAVLTGIIFLIMGLDVIYFLGLSVSPEPKDNKVIDAIIVDRKRKDLLLDVYALSALSFISICLSYYLPAMVVVTFSVALFYMGLGYILYMIFKYYKPNLTEREEHEQP